MAEREQVRENASGGIIGMIVKAWNAVMADGAIEAAWRQGAKEVGEALKAFPDSIQVTEHGTLFSPTQGEIATARADDAGRPPWPSEIAERNRHLPVQDQGRGQDHTHDAGHSM